MVYELLYHALQICQLYASAQNEKQAENQLFLQIKSERILNILWAFLTKKIIPLAHVGYEMIIAISYPINALSWNNC